MRRQMVTTMYNNNIRLQIIGEQNIVPEYSHEEAVCTSVISHSMKNNTSIMLLKMFDSPNQDSLSSESHCKPSPKNKLSLRNSFYQCYSQICAALFA